MQLSKRLGYAAYPLLTFMLLAAPQMQARAQSTQDNQPQAPQAQASQAQSDAQSVESAPQQTQQGRVQMLRKAQARVKARRKLREKQVIQQTYGQKYEAYFGSGYLRFRPGKILQHMNEASWNVGITDYFRGKLGATADFRGYYGSAYTYDNQYHTYQPSISQYTFMAGPQYRFFEGMHWGWSAQVLAGAGHGNFGTGTNGLPPTLIGLYPDATVFNMSVGAAVDYNLTPKLAIRLMPDYLMTDYGSSLQHNLGFSISGVYRWGRQ